MIELSIPRVEGIAELALSEPVPEGEVREHRRREALKR